MFKLLSKVVLSPLNGVAEVARDISGRNGESSQGVSILTLGASSLIKGTTKGVVSAMDELFE